MFLFLRESQESFNVGVKLELLLGQKMIEGFESMLSLLVSGDAVAVAGHLPGVPSLTPTSAELKWASIASSIACLSLLGMDLDKKAIQEQEELAHLRSSTMTDVHLFAFHVSEVTAAMVVIPYASATRPWGLLALAVFTALSVLLLSVRALRGYDGDWDLEGDKVLIRGKHMFFMGQDLGMSVMGEEAEVTTGKDTFPASLLPARDIMRWGSVRLISEDGSPLLLEAGKTLCRQETKQLYEAGWRGDGACAGLLRTFVACLIYAPTCFALNMLAFFHGTLMQELALLRVAVFTTAWLVLLCRGATGPPELREELASPHTACLSGLAALGFLLHLVLLWQQWRCGRFALTWQPSGMSTEAAEYKYQPLLAVSPSDM